MEPFGFTFFPCGSLTTQPPPDTDNSSNAWMEPLFPGNRKRTLYERAVSRVSKIFMKIQDHTGTTGESFLAEFEAARLWFRGRNEIFHFLYGEQCFRYLGLIKKWSRRNFIVCTYHTPPDKFNNVVKKPEHIKDVDAVIVLSKMQIECLSQYVDRSRIHYVPRGVDTSYFNREREKATGS